MKENYQPNEVYKNDEIDLIAFIILLWKKKVIIISFTVIFSIIVGIYLYFFTSRPYTITTSIDNMDLVPSDFVAIKNMIVSDKTKSEISSLLPDELKRSLLQNANYLKNIVKISSYPDLEKVKKGEEIGRINALYITTGGSDQKNSTLVNSAVYHTILKKLIFKKTSFLLDKEFYVMQTKLHDLSKKEVIFTQRLPMEKQKLESMKKLEKNAVERVESSYPALQFEIGNKLQYLPLGTQINMLETGMINDKASLTRFKQEKKRYAEISNELAKLKNDFPNPKSFDAVLFLKKVRKIAENSKSKYAKATFFSYYNMFNIEMLKYKSNTGTSLEVGSRKILSKTGIAFVMFLFISSVFVLLSEAVKNHNKKEHMK